MKIIITGLIGQYSFGGVIWDYIQYVLGFRSLGHEVIYLEDSGAWPYDPKIKSITNDCSFVIKKLNKIFSYFNLSECWSYRNPINGKFYGLEEKKVRDYLKYGDILINVSSAGWLKDYDINVDHRIFIDTDPMFCQVGLLDGCDPFYASRLRNHDSHFTFALSINNLNCKIPKDGINWIPTVQPIAINYWKTNLKLKNNYWTTVMNWSSYNNKVWKGQLYGQKNIEFNKFIHLPLKTKAKFKLAIGSGNNDKLPKRKLIENGWGVLDPDKIVHDHINYFKFLEQSFGEWSIAKNGYVISKSGWFSCRSACYLALGKPVILQDTGWSNHLPSNKGAFAFNTIEESIESIDMVNRNYDFYSKKAKELAKEFFDAKKVCANILKRI